MKRQTAITLGLALLGLLLLGGTVLAGPLPPADKVINAHDDDSAPTTARWYLRNGAFDEQWDGDVPQFWQIYPGDADAYGPLDFLNPDASDEVTDNAFVFKIVNDEVKSDRNAYLYQGLTLPPGDYWLNVHLSIYGAGSGERRSSNGDIPGAYTYMAYYALVPYADVMLDGSFAPDLVGDDDWKELWPWSTVCSEKVKGWDTTGQIGECDYVKRAETRSVTGGKNVFILRAELKWPDWRAFAYYVFDDIQIILATPLEDNLSDCVTSYCLEGLIKRR